MIWINYLTTSRREVTGIYRDLRLGVAIPKNSELSKWWMITIQPDTIGETWHFTIQKWLGKFRQKRFKNMVNQLANDWKKWSFDQPVMDRNMWNSDWMGSWPTAGNSRWVLLRLLMSFFLICKKLTCNFQEKCFFSCKNCCLCPCEFSGSFLFFLQLQMD